MQVSGTCSHAYQFEIVQMFRVSVTTLSSFADIEDLGIHFTGGVMSMRTSPAFNLPIAVQFEGVTEIIGLL